MILKAYLFALVVPMNLKRGFLIPGHVINVEIPAPSVAVRNLVINAGNQGLNVVALNLLPSLPALVLWSLI
jgi:hypothetical protein